MQQQDNAAGSIITHEQILSLNHLINTAISGRSSEEINGANRQLNQILHHNYLYFQAICNFIRPNSNVQNNFKVGCCSVIKNFMYNLADQQNIDKNRYIMDVQELTITVGVTRTMKQILGMSIEHILNKDQTEQYKNKFLNRVVANLERLIQNLDSWSLETLEIAFGSVTLLLAYMNSLIEPVDLIQFFINILPVLALLSNNCLNFLTQYQTETEKLQDNHFEAIMKIFEIIEIAIERLFDQEDEISEQMTAIKQSQILFNTLITHMAIFSQGKSIITNYPTLNAIKQSILEIIHILNMSVVGAIPRPITEMVFMTFLIQSIAVRSQKRQMKCDDHAEQILCRAMEIVETQLEIRVNLNLYTDHKIDILFALLMYSRTTSEEKQLFENEPDKFSEIANDYTEGFSKSPNLKIRAANLLKAFLKAFDEGLSNLVQIIVIFITTSLGTDENNQTIQILKQQMGNYDFWGLSSDDKLDIAFMILSLISPLVLKKQKLYEVVMAILFSQVQLLVSLQNKIVQARLIRLIGYYPTAIYFAYIQDKMRKQRTFVKQGLNAFEMISKNRGFMEIFPHMALVYTEIIEFIEVTDSIFEQIVMNNYENVIKKQLKLYSKIIEKLKLTIHHHIKNANETDSKHKILLSFNYLYKLMKREKDEECLQMLFAAFVEIQPLAKWSALLDDIIIQIYEIMVQKYFEVTQKTLQFFLQFGNQHKLNTYSGDTPYFRAVLKVLKTDNQNFIAALYLNLSEHLFSYSPNDCIVNKLCFVIGYLHITNKNLKVDEAIINTVSQRILKNDQHTKDFLFLFFNMLFLFPRQIRQCLIVRDSYYSIMMMISNTYFNSRIYRKAAVIALQQLLTHEPQIQLNKEIIKMCIRFLKEQRRVYLLKPSKKQYRREKKLAGMRLMLNDDDFEVERVRLAPNVMGQAEQEQGIQDEMNRQDNQGFQGMKHPFQSYDEFQMFKYKLQSFENPLQLLQESDRGVVSELCNFKWHKNKIIKYFSLKKQF